MSTWISRAGGLPLPCLIAAIFANANLLVAGTVQLTAHAHDSTGELHVTRNASHPTSAFADTGNVTKPGAHARSWGAAFISGGTLKKSAGGQGWVTNGNSAKHQYWYANAGTGEFIISSPSLEPARIRLMIQRSGDVVDPVQPTVAPPEIGEYPSQGIFAEFDFGLHVKLDAAITQDGQTSDLFHGQAFIGGPDHAAPGLAMSGDFAAENVFEPIQLQGNPGQQRLGAIVPNLVISRGEALVQANVPFTVDLDLIMSQYVIDAFPFEPPLVDTGNVLASSSGDLVVGLLVEDSSGNPLTISAVIPEPGSLALGGLGAALLAAFAVRKNRSFRRRC